MSDFTEKDLRSDDLVTLQEFSSRCQNIDPLVARLALDTFKRGLISRYYFAGNKFGWLRYQEKI